MKKINTRKALNPAYRKHKPLRKNVNQFVEHLKECIDVIKHIDTINESEEHLKNPITNFLQKTFYSENLINTKDRIDLAIYLGKNAKSDVGVLIEAKKPSNKSEFLTETNLNRKALQELLLYYLQERIDNKNNNIKHLIATNGYEWYLFKSEDFYNYFYKNKALLKEYKAFKDGLKDTTKNELFYNEIAKKYIEQVHSELPFVHLDFSNTKFDNLSDAHLNTLYKIFSNVHLLGHAFGNDSNQLNKAFYNELLHIIGLEEVKDKGKKIISRKSVKDRDYASILENAIFHLEDRDYLPNVKSVENSSDKAFNVGLELCLTWVNRILFLKLLESQLLAYHKNDAKYKFLNASFINGYDDLNDLFFSALAKKEDERHPKYKDKYKDIPYLNSSLFELSDLEKEAFEISSLSNDESEVFSGTVLKDPNGKRLKGKLPTLDYLFQFLDAYDFATDGNEGIEDSQETKSLINASVLGLIFEKINGYKEGSFYTPAYITMYMCKETLRRAVIQKFKEQENDQIETFEDLQSYCRRLFKVDDLKRLNTIIDSLRICDPAVGSGHFLVSALNELIVIKNELGILIDAKGLPLSCDIEIVNDELYVLDNNGLLFEYIPGNKESTRIQHTLFHQKQTIIENCLFGVDINPNSVKICRLRLWIELLKNAYYTNENRLQTLPNIDINIKCGNSLISRFDLKDDLKDAFKGKEVKYNFKQYKDAVEKYKNTNSKDKKREVLEIINEVKNNFKSTLDNKFINSFIKIQEEFISENERINNLKKFEEKISKAEKDRLKKLKAKLEKTFAEKEEIVNNAIYHNAFEWRFEFPEVLAEDGSYIGFDAVIGNPPYIYNRDIEKVQRDFLKDKYRTADDLYVYFTYESYCILKDTGYLSFITPNTYFTLSSRQNFRKKLLKSKFLKFTYSGYCFEDAYVETMILFANKDFSLEQGCVQFINDSKDFNNSEIYTSDSILFLDNLYTRFFIPTQLNIKLNTLINSKIKVVGDKFSSKLTGKSYDENVLNEYKRSLNENDLTLLGVLCSGEQGLVTGNNSKYISKIITSEDEKQVIDNKFINELNKFLDIKINIQDFTNDPDKYYLEAEIIKQKYKPDIFGKFFIYKNCLKDSIKEFSLINKEIQKNGNQERIWVNYYKGNSEGYKWYVPYTEAIDWSCTSVKELREGLVTNSRWQGEKYFSTTGFGWVDYFTKSIKAFFVDKGIYSKNIVKLHCNSNLISDKFIVALLNSKFINYYIRNFITSTHTLQINDGRLIPLVIPSNESKINVENKVTIILKIKEANPEADTTALESEIDQLVYELYGLTEEEIAIVENS